MKTYKAESTVRPATWDKESSPNVVYHNNNITEVVRQEEGQEPLTVYQYDVTEFTNKEYIALLDDQISEQADALIELAELIGG